MPMKGQTGSFSCAEFPYESRSGRICWQLSPASLQTIGTYSVARFRSYHRQLVSNAVFGLGKGWRSSSRNPTQNGCHMPKLCTQCEGMPGALGPMNRLICSMNARKALLQIVAR